TGPGKEGRIRIVGISPHGDGTRAGLKEQDIILGVDGTPVHDVADLKIALLDKEVGENVTLQILRERDLLPDEHLDITLKLTTMQSIGMMMPPGHPKK
ncbi:MAG TPA: PDZ domain-containing protein, partial [Desulfobulbaceae bacterium]|nr:PDZ domain-containing protein [Desulfobulbaceae bacterium]